MQLPTLLVPLSDMFRTIFAPKSEFVRVKEKTRWAGLFVYLCIGKIIVESLHYSIELKVLKTVTSGTLEAAQIERAFGFINMTAWFTVVLVPIFIIVKNMIIAGILYWLIVLLARNTDFKKLFSVSLRCWLIFLIGRYFNLAILYIKGTEQISHLEDLKVNLGLDIFLRGDESILLRTICENITIFSVWYILSLIHI